MDESDIRRFVQEIVDKANSLKNKHTSEKEARANYACIFCHDNEQYDNLASIMQRAAKIIEDTSTGPLFHIPKLDTVAGPLQLLKIRSPDVARPELGDADFTIENYSEFKKKYLSEVGFKLITREKFEMIELIDPQFDVLAYFSNPPLDKQLGIN